MIKITRQGRCLECAVTAFPLPGEELSGDMHVVLETKKGALVGVIDGLGHGNEAARASEHALSVLEHYREETLFYLVKKCHDELLQTRGVVFTLAAFNFGDDTMAWVSVGNVEGVLIRANPADEPNVERSLQRSGVIGYRLPPIHASMLSVFPGDTLVLASDGIKPLFHGDIKRKQPVEMIAKEIGERYLRGIDDAVVFVGRYS
jgi:serine phosphatase RsbU (regulator of sigma subunit)